MKNGKKEPNFKFGFICEKLGIDVSMNGYSNKVQKVINAVEDLGRRVEVTGSQSEFFYFMSEMFRNGLLVFEKNNTIEHLAEFIYQNFLIRQESNPKKFLKLSSIKTKLYEI